ncbi:MAG: penicillin acylase family protein, partial [Candidatus Hodarchaeales archaeon]
MSEFKKMKKKEICLISCLFVIFVLGFMSTLVKDEEFDSTVAPETIVITPVGTNDEVFDEEMSVDTPVGTNVEVSDEETGVNITFSEVTNGGITNVEKSVEGPEPPSDFIAVSDYYDITTDATFSGSIAIAIPYVETQIYANEQFLRLLHWDPTSGWLDITTDVDTINNIMYGEALQLSKFLIAEIILENNEILIIRDNFGVPHVFANQKEGLGFGVGYAMAQDRLWQMDYERREAYGSLFEFGLGSINSDSITRSLGYSRQELHDMFYNWVPTKANGHLKVMMLAYVDDSVAAIIMTANRLGRTGGNELSYAGRYQTLTSNYGEDLGWDMFNDLFPQVDPGAPVTIPSEGSEYTDFVDYSSISNLPNIQNELQESIDLTTKSGSNAWVISPQKSTNGNTLQLGGLQVGHSMPAWFVEVGMHGAGINAVGMMIPCAPFILTGVNEHGAWTMTTGTSDLVDTYIEVLNPDNQYQYLYNDEWVDMEMRTERIYGPLKSLYVEYDIYRTVHGPLIHPVAGWDLANNIAYTMKVPFFKNEIAAVEGWMLFQEAKNVVDAEEACKNIDININFLWADREGDIGYWHTGKFPIKPTHGTNGRRIDDRFPLWGTGEEEWIGVTGFEEMPKCINPEQGYLVNWNNKPKADWPYREADWGEFSKGTWIQRQLTALEKVSFEDMKEINRNTGYNHMDGMYFLDFLINAAKNDPDIPIEVIAALEAWDHHYNDVLEPIWRAPDATYDDPGLTIFDAWFSRIDNEVFDDDLPPNVRADSSTLLHVFDGVNSKLALNFDYLNGEDRDEVIVRVLKEALIVLEDDYGSSEVSDWLTPVRITYLWSQGALPTPRVHYMNRGSFNHIAEMQKSSLPYVENVLPPGQSGFLNYLGQFNHAYDQLSLYENWAYKPVHFKYQEIKEVAESEMILIRDDVYTPVAVDDSETTDEDVPITIDVLANDYYLDSNNLIIVDLTDPIDGTVIDNGDGTITFLPDANFNGVTSFTYKVFDGIAESNTATVTITVNAVNDAPVA